MASGKEVIIYHVTMLGMEGVGKTSIIKKLKKSQFRKVYEPTLANEIKKYTLTQKIKDLEDATVKISFKDGPGFSSTKPSDKSFLIKKAHILCCVYDYDNNDSFECIEHLLTVNDELFATNYIVMVVRNKVDSKAINTESESKCNEQFKAIKAINDEIVFIKNFSAKIKSVEKIEKAFIKSIELYREYYGNKKPPGTKRKKSLKSDTYNAGTPTSQMQMTVESEGHNVENAEGSNGDGCSCIIL